MSPKPGKSRVRVVPAAGAVLYRMDGDSPLCAVVHRPRYDDWSLPKGKVDAGEALPVTAVREIEEETGFAAELRSRIGTTAYPLKENTRKEVTYWSALATGGDFHPNSEVDEIRWVPVDEAKRLVSYPLDRKILTRFDDAPRARSVLLLVRHAKAGRRSEWSGDDDLRPLEKNGRVQAEMLAPMLSAFGVTRLHSAPRVRCEQTLAPLADELGESVATEPALSDEAYLDDPAAAVSRLIRIAAGDGIAAVSSQGTAIPGMVCDLAGPAGLDVGDASTKKAGVWVLGFDGGAVVHADYYPSPLPLF
ncbi:NUDIX hydrolase [Dietzia massiliensis]|uniref:NUDIX hydrolase n=1 Tax=Dietzia massiliensis TaxID=2697499 RepID=UPI001BD0EAB2|nr:NUDIX hydrolase [Dietzia massiliensis]MBS7547579.1 NUDIX hydrolase [Dietzia massiliensis]